MKGKVLDKVTNEALAGALILIEGTNIQAYSDLDGNFTIEGLKPGEYEIKCSLISYKDEEHHITEDKISEEQILISPSLALIIS